jgi:hypothetical protein
MPNSGENFILNGFSLADISGVAALAEVNPESKHVPVSKLLFIKSLRSMLYVFCKG